MQGEEREGHDEEENCEREIERERKEKRRGGSSKQMGGGKARERESKRGGMTGDVAVAAAAE